MSVVTAPTESYRNSRSVHTTRRVSPTREGQLELGQFYHITGQAEGLEQLPAQVFRLERLERTSYSGSRILTGTLWWRVWVNGRWYSGVLTDHILADHHVNLGARTNGLHDFHFEAIEREEVPKVLGQGRAYHDFLAQTNPNFNRKLLVA